MPFELLIMRSRCKYTSSGDAYEYLDDLNSLLRKCKKYVRTTVELSDEDREMWKERASRVALLISSQFIAMNVRTHVIYVQVRCTTDKRFLDRNTRPLHPSFKVFPLLLRQY
jgi:hypothetical protein